jgi:hypothetical protein
VEDVGVDVPELVDNDEVIGLSVAGGRCGRRDPPDGPVVPADLLPAEARIALGGAVALFEDRSEGVVDLFSRPELVSG